LTYYIISEINHIDYFLYLLVFFFFQAEDGIRDRNVTGVQTCALPILYSLIYLLMNKFYYKNVFLNQQYGLMISYYIQCLLILMIVLYLLQPVLMKLHNQEYLHQMVWSFAF